MAARFIGVVGTLLITRFLDPEVMGEVGVAVIVMYTAREMSKLGFDQYVVAKPEASRATIFHITVYNLVGAVVAIAAAVAVAAPIAPLFDAPDMTQYIPGMAVVVFLQRASLIPERIVVRDMRFRVYALGASLPELLYTALSLYLAASSWGGHAIVIANICQFGFRALYFFAAVSRRDWLAPTALTWKTTRDIVRFGVPIAIGNLAGFAAGKWDNLLMSRMFGPAVMGAYNLAYNLAQIPADYIGVAIADVLMPSFAHMEPERARSALARSIRLLALVVFPLAAGLGAVSETLVAAIFNQEWQGIAPFLMVLAFPAVAGPMGDAVSVYLKARDMPRAVMVINVATSALLLCAVAALGLIGPLWAALGVGLATWAYAGLSLWIIQRCDQVPAWPVLRGLVGPTLACAAMTGAVFGVRWVLGRAGLGSMPAQLALEIATGAAVYVVAAFGFAPASSRELVRRVREVLGRG